MPGPLPTPNPRRRNAPTIPTTSLPAGGRQGDPPESPLPLEARGLAWWDWAWSTPQAAAWDAGALYVIARRASLEDDGGLAPASRLREMRELDDRLGLTPKGMAALRWRIVDDGTPDAKPAAAKRPAAARGHLRAVDPDLAG